MSLNFILFDVADLVTYLKSCILIWFYFSLFFLL